MKLRDKIRWIEYYMRMNHTRVIDDWDDVGAFALEHKCPDPAVPTKAQALGRQFARAAGKWYAESGAGRLQRKLVYVPAAKPGMDGLWCDSEDNLSRRQIERVVDRLTARAVGLLASASNIAENWHGEHLDDAEVPVPTDLKFDVALRRAAAAAEREEKAS